MTSRFQFVDDHRATYEVKRLCQVLDVNRSSYYKWLAGAEARAGRQREDLVLAEKIREVHGESGGAYGSPRVTAELREKGHAANEKRIARVMRAFDITGIRLRRRVRTTVPDPAAGTVPDLLGRDFTATEPGRKLMGSGSRRELPPPAPTEPCVTVSRYTALVTLSTRSDGQTASGRTSLGIAV
ncbi:IS3 family transposase [Streptomyces microflavus]|uniref:IS3 family transposase n=1 Tax=Streptomyces microflavus TaxID=1919 RepID=UPI00332FE2E2